MPHALARRVALTGLGAFALVGLAACNTPQATSVQPQAHPSGFQISAIEVDTSRLQAQNGSQAAGWVQQALPGQLSRAFAAHMAPAGQGGQTLTVRIDSINLGPVGPGGSATDSIKGEATLGGGAGAPRHVSLRTTTQYTPSPVDQALWQQALQGRVNTLSQSFAFWLARRMRE